MTEQSPAESAQVAARRLQQTYGPGAGMPLGSALTGPPPVAGASSQLEPAVTAAIAAGVARAHTAPDPVDLDDLRSSVAFHEWKQRMESS